MCGARYRDLHTWARALHPLTQLLAHLIVTDEFWLSTHLMYDSSAARTRPCEIPTPLTRMLLSLVALAGIL